MLLSWIRGFMKILHGTQAPCGNTFSLHNVMAGVFCNKSCFKRTTATFDLYFYPTYKLSWLFTWSWNTGIFYRLHLNTPRSAYFLFSALLNLF